MVPLIAFEGLDQSGKQTQTERVSEFDLARGRECRMLSFPDYATPIGSEIARALHGANAISHAGERRTIAPVVPDHKELPRSRSILSYSTIGLDSVR